MLRNPIDTNRPLVVIESPYAGSSIKRKIHAEYLRRCVLDSISRGEAPFASHAMYPCVLDENTPEERALGIQCGFNWLDRADYQIFYVDHGWSLGMKIAWTAGRYLKRPWLTRAFDTSAYLEPPFSLNPPPDWKMRVQETDDDPS